jgi:hypothetical protein
MPRARMPWPIVLLIPLGLPVTVSAADEKTVPPPAASAPSPKPVLLPGGIADDAGRTGFLASAVGGIEAIDLQTGEVLWESIEAQRPLLLVGSRLIAQAGIRRNRFRILVYEVRTGECMRESDPVVLPGWVVTGSAPGRSFDARWRLEGNVLVCAWEAEAWYADSAHPTTEQAEAARKQASGVARIDLDTGIVESGPAEKTETGPPPKALKELEKLAVRWQGAIGPFTAALVLEESSSGQSLVLRMWEPATGKAAEPRELLHGKRLLVQTTLDGKYLCLRDGGTRPDEKGSRTLPEQSWMLVSLDLAAPIRKVPYEAGTQTLAVVGSRLFYAVSGPVQGAIHRPLVQPRTLKAVNLESGKVLWQRPVAGKSLHPPTR